MTLIGSLLVAFNVNPFQECGTDCFGEFQRFVGSTGSIGSLGVLIFLFYRDPLKNIRQSVTNLVKVNVIFLGYVRRINQIDATFKQIFLDLSGFDVAQMQATVAEIEKSVEKTLAKIQLYLEGPPPRMMVWPDGLRSDHQEDTTIASTNQREP